MRGDSGAQPLSPTAEPRSNPCGVTARTLAPRRAGNFGSSGAAEAPCLAAELGDAAENRGVRDSPGATALIDGGRSVRSPERQGPLYAAEPRRSTRRSRKPPPPAVFAREVIARWMPYAISESGRSPRVDRTRPNGATAPTSSVSLVSSVSSNDTASTARIHRQHLLDYAGHGSRIAECRFHRAHPGCSSLALLRRISGLASAIMRTDRPGSSLRMRSVSREPPRGSTPETDKLLIPHSGGKSIPHRRRNTQTSSIQSHRIQIHAVGDSSGLF